MRKHDWGRKYKKLSQIQNQTDSVVNNDFQEIIIITMYTYIFSRDLQSIAI